MSVILPSRLSWALSDRPARSKGMWFGIVGAFVAGIAVAGVAGNIPKVAEERSITPEKAPVEAKVAAPKVAAPDATNTGSANPRQTAGKPARNKFAGKASSDTAASSQVAASEISATEKPVAEKQVAEKPATDQSVRIIGADRITPPPGSDPAPAATAGAPAPANSAVLTVPTAATTSPEAATTGSVTRPQEKPAFIVNSFELAEVTVPLPREKPASLLAAVAADTRQPQKTLQDTRPAQDATATAAIAGPGDLTPEIPPAAITGRVPMPRTKPIADDDETEVAERELDGRYGTSPTARLQNEGSRNSRVERRDMRDYDRRPPVYDRRPAVMESRREMRRIERAEARAAEARAREIHRRNKAEGFELVRSYRGPDGRRVSVYQRMEPRVVAYQARPLFGRPALLMPQRGYWR